MIQKHYFSPIKSIELVLYFAKDVQSIANNKLVDMCINLVEEWLDTRDDALAEKLRSARVSMLHTRYAIYHPSFSLASSSILDAISMAELIIATYTNACFVAYCRAAIQKAATAKAWNEYPVGDENADLRYGTLLKFKNEYETIEANWTTKWTNPSFYLKSICQDDTPDEILFDYLIDENLISYLIPNNYLNLPLLETEFIGENQHQVIQNILNSSKRKLVTSIVRRMSL